MTGGAQTSAIDFGALLATERRQSTRTLMVVAAVVASASASAGAVGLFDVARLAEGVPALLHLAGEMMPPAFTDVGAWLRAIADTMAMSIAGTTLAVALSVPLGILAARNTSPHPAVFLAARSVLNLLRSVPELIMGIVFVAAVGFGPLPGVLALGLHSVGMVGKFFSEAVEHADPAPVEAARATGASALQVVWHGVMPQVLPQFADVAVYRWEYNFRASTVMGMVGAGGIGFELMGALRIMQYQEVAAILLLILVLVTAVDATGGLLRRRLK
jgi:phosphonate transport system permease protein